MSRRQDFEIRITPSIIDRLIDFEPRSANEAPGSRSKSLRELKQSVRRDLEWLLNARSYPNEIDEGLEEVRKSVIAFGLPDITGISAKNHIEVKKMTGQLETAIRNFEPRFLDLKVILEPVSNTDQMLAFRIEAFLNVEPTPEPVVFDTVLELSRGDFQVNEK